MHRVVCPGSFDPVTNGHLDIIGRAAGLYDEVIVAVLINVTKQGCSPWTSGWRCCARPPAHYGNVRIERFHGLLVDFCAANGITAVVKGLRAVSDFEYEMQMAQMNYRMAKVETLFMTTNPLYSFLQFQSGERDREVRRGRQRAGARPVLARLRQPADRGVSAAGREPGIRRVRSSWDYRAPPVG